MPIMGTFFLKFLWYNRKKIFGGIIMRTIGFINWKGGVGKTCIAINTAYALAESWNAKILFIDMDKQANASYWFEKNENFGTLGNILVNATDADEVKNIKKMSAEEVIQKTRYKNIDLIAADTNLLDINLAILKNNFGRQDNILKNALKNVQKNYDVCIVDNPPDSNIPVLNGLEIIDDVIAVTLPNRFSLNGINQLEQEIKNYNEILKLKIFIRGVLVNQFTSTENCYKIIAELREKYKIFPHIRGGKNTQNWLDKVINEQKSIYEIAPRSSFAKDLMKFLENLVGE